jgi:hypothetical protein
MCMHIIRFSHFFRLRIPKTLPFLFLPNATLNPDFQTCTAFGEESMPRKQVLIRATHKRQLYTQITLQLICALQIPHFTLGHRPYIQHTR